MALTNELPGQADTVLAGTSAVFRVSVKDAAGNPAANQNAVITLESDTPGNNGKRYVLSDATTVVTTDANGNATFVVKPDSTAAVKNDEEDYVSSYKYTVKVNDESKEGILKVAAIAYGVQSGKSVENLNGTASYSAIKPGSNVGTEKNGQYKRETQNIKGRAVQYIGSQQVSRSDENKVAFQTDVFLKIPGYSGDKAPAKDAYQEINLKSEKYHTYASSGSTTQSKDLEQKDLSNVAYATVRFNSLKLSKHTRAVVKLKYSNGSESTVATYGYDDVTFEQGEGFGLQLSKDQLKNAVSISFSLEAEGQVDLGSNDGYNVKDIVYVFNSQKGTPAEYVHYNGVKVDWAIEDKVYYDDEIQLRTNGTAVTNVNNTGKAAYYDASQANKLVTNATAIVNEIVAATDSEDDCYNITYSAPAFPDNGNAIIKCYDRNNKVKKYFACATINNGSNVNVLYFNTADKKQNLLYEITEQEAKNNSADCEIAEKDPDKGLVVVNAKKSGVTHLMGTVSSDDPKISAVLDAENTHVYTSVMWNPVIDSSNNAAGIALAGQTATVVAQLIDDNDNPVAQSGQKISWTLPNGWNAQGVKKVEEQTSTDPKGQAALKLSAANAAELIGVNASTTSGYKVKLILADKASTKGADIYWVDLHLEYKASVFKTTGDDADTTDEGTASGRATAKVGEKWEYASKVIACSIKNKEGKIDGKFQGGVLQGKTVDAVTGIVPTLSKQPSSKGTVEFDTKEGRATVTSNEVTDNSAIIFRLTPSNSPKGDTTIKVGTDTYALIGTGSISANETLTLNYVFETVGSEIGFILPNGNKSAQNEALGEDEQIVYLQLRDSKGNPIKLKDETGCKERIKVSVTSNSGLARIKNIVAGDGYVNNFVTDGTKVGNPYLLSTEESAYKDETGVGSTEVVYTAFSNVSKYSNKAVTPGTVPNTDGILAIKLTDTRKEDVVVTASYEEVRGTTTRTVNVLTTQTQSYSFVDDEKLPVFTFDTAQDNGRNRIFYDSDKNEITVAFKNDLLASSVKADQFIVQRLDDDNDDITDGVGTGTTSTLVVKDVTINGNKAVIKLTGNLTDLTGKTYFKVFVGVDDDDATEVLTFDKNIRYIFTSEDGQELGSKKSIVFPADSKISIEGLSLANVTTDFANPAKDWTAESPANVAAAVVNLALAGVNIPTATVDNEDAAYLQAIQEQIAANSAATLEEIQKAAKEAIEKVQEDKKKANAAIENNSVLKGKQLKGRTLKGAALEKARAIGITVKNTSAASASGSAISVSVATTGSAISVAYEPANGTVSSTSSSVPETLLAPSASGKVYLQADSESVSNCEVKIVIETRYYTRTYTISNFTVGKDAAGKIIITGGKIKDEMKAEYHSTL